MRSHNDLFGAFDSVDTDSVDPDEMLARVHTGSAALQTARRRRVAVLSVAAAAILLAVGAVVVPSLGNDRSDRGQVATTPTPTSDQPRASGAILYSGMVSITHDHGGVGESTEIGVFCSDVVDCNLLGFTFGGHDIIRLVRDGPGTFSAVLDGPGLTSCDSAEGLFPTTVTISLDEYTMTMTGHSDGQTLVCGPETLTRYEENVTFQGTYVSGDLPDL